jgi:hypothetical protein
MSELSRQVAANTQGVSGAYRGLVAIKARNRERKKEALEGIASAIKDAGDQYRKHLSWRDAQEAEREIAEVENAYALGYTTKGGEGARAALSGVRPKTAKGAVLLSARMREAAKDQQYEVEWKSKEAERAANAQAKKRADLMDFALGSAELDAKKKEAERKDSKDAADRQAEMDRLKFKTAADALKWWQSRPADKRPDPDDLPVPENQRVMVEKRHGLPDGYLSGVTHRQLREMLAAETARVNATKVREENPRVSPRAKAQIDAIKQEINAIDEFVNTNSGMSRLRGEVEQARERRAALVQQRDTLINGLPDGGGEAPDQARQSPAQDPTAQSVVDPALKARFDGMTPDMQAQFLSKATPEQRAKVGRCGPTRLTNFCG